MKYVQKHCLKENVCTLQVFLCALISRPVCVHTHAQHSLEGTLVVWEFQKITQMGFCWDEIL